MIDVVSTVNVRPLHLSHPEGASPSLLILWICCVCSSSAVGDSDCYEEYE